jgi:hypothetical protein
MQASHFQHHPDLLPRYAGEVIQKNFQGVARAQMVKKAFNRDARSAKNRLAPKPRRVFFNAFGQPAGGCLVIVFQNRCHAATLSHRTAIWQLQRS